LHTDKATKFTNTSKRCVLLSSSAQELAHPLATQSEKAHLFLHCPGRNLMNSVGLLKKQFQSFVVMTASSAPSDRRFKHTKTKLTNDYKNQNPDFLSSNKPQQPKYRSQAPACTLAEDNQECSEFYCTKYNQRRSSLRPASKGT
jgi:hypothetical protein